MISLNLCSSKQRPASYQPPRRKAGVGCVCGWVGVRVGGWVKQSFEAECSAHSHPPSHIMSTRWGSTPKSHQPRQGRTKREGRKPDECVFYARARGQDGVVQLQDGTSAPECATGAFGVARLAFPPDVGRRLAWLIRMHLGAFDMARLAFPLHVGRVQAWQRQCPGGHLGYPPRERTQRDRQ
jgi:hypothetical protein